ncbi:MAG: hypothetical protein K1X92_16910 [Bacteroidia bacterium]|nr:hypothetical protein [Bacteroidia bacterium]
MDQTILESLYVDFEKIKPLIKELSDRIIQEEISEYPIFIASHQWVDIGKPIVNREEMELNWYFYVSILEDFVRKKLIPQNNVTQFKSTYGDAEEKACMFTIIDKDANFIFIPYKEVVLEEEDFGEL